MIQFAIDEKVDLVLIAGDIFDGDWSDYKSGLEFIAGLADLDKAGVRVAMVRGNHDAANKMSCRLKWPKNTFEFRSRTPETHVIDDLDVAIHGQSFPNGAVPQNLAQNYPVARGDLFNIGLLHTSGSGPSAHATYAPCSVNDLTAKGYDYWALGHVHTRSTLCDSPPVVFPGNLQGRHINEPGERGFMLVTVEANHVQDIRFVPIDVLRYSAPRYLLRDRDASYGSVFRDRVRVMGVEEVVTAPRSPWQNPYVERLIGSIRRECLDHIVIFNEHHLRDVLSKYFEYHHKARTHLSLNKDCPQPRHIQPPSAGKIIALPQVGGLHHRYERRAA